MDKSIRSIDGRHWTIPWHDRYYTLCDLARHIAPNDCWLHASGLVYDVSLFLHSHPGGIRSILSHAGGADCKEDLEFHGKAAQALWRECTIGKIRACGAKGSEEFAAMAGKGGLSCAVQ